MAIGLTKHGATVAIPASSVNRQSGHGKNFAGYKQRGPSKLPLEFLEQSLRYRLGIEGVAGAVVGVYGVEEVKQNVEWAKRWKPLMPTEHAALREAGKKLVTAWGPRFGPVA